MSCSPGAVQISGGLLWGKSSKYVPFLDGFMRESNLFGWSFTETNPFLDGVLRESRPFVEPPRPKKTRFRGFPRCRLRGPGRPRIAKAKKISCHRQNMASGGKREPSGAPAGGLTRRTWSYWRFPHSVQPWFCSQPWVFEWLPETLLIPHAFQPYGSLQNRWLFPLGC